MWLVLRVADSSAGGWTLQYAIHVICTLNRLKLGKQAVRQKLQQLLTYLPGGQSDRKASRLRNCLEEQQGLVYHFSECKVLVDMAR